MANFLVQLTSDPEPRPWYDVDQGEYDRLDRLGLIVNGSATPTSPGVFTQEVADAINDVGGPAYAAGRAQFTPRATATPPVNPADGDLWFTVAPPP